MSEDESPTPFSETELDATAAKAAVGSTFREGTVLAARYELRRVLGRGGMGVVVLAWDRTLGEEVAIKVLRPELANDRRWGDRLAREVKLARQIQNSNVCRVFDFEQADGHVFLVMELATGNLRSEMQSGALATQSLAVRVADARAITSGLAAIHDKGIVHRDVTPQNVLRMRDGRLVVADFGLATDTTESIASIHGGTTAYMAPEVAMGGRASCSSDVWAVGVVIHEMIFGEPPRWRGGIPGRGMERPGRRLVPSEIALFEVCRRFTADRPAARPRDGVAALRVLKAAEGFRARRVTRAAVVVLSCALVTGVVTAGYWLWRGRHRSPPAVSSNGAMPVTGTSADWTDTSRVLASVPGVIHCLARVAGRPALRFVWGDPAHAEDVNIQDGRRSPSPLKATAYAQGCPDLAPDGRHLIFQGYDRDGRSSVFLSENADGSGAAPVVAAADPTVSTEPKWLEGGSAFVFDIDQRHLGVFDRTSMRTTVLPGGLNPADYSLVHLTNGNRAFAIRLAEGGSTHVSVISWPTSTIIANFSVVGWKDYCHTPDGEILYCVEAGTTLVRIDGARREARRLASIRDQAVAHSARVADGIGFVSTRAVSDAWIGSGPGELTRLTNDGQTWEVTSCGRDEFLVSRGQPHSPWEIVRLAKGGRLLKTHVRGYVTAPACSRKGSDWWFTDDARNNPSLKHCDEAGCVSIAKTWAQGLALSPDETRLAFLTGSERGTHVRWISSNGGAVHEVGDSETFCSPGWSSNHTLWISRRRRGAIIWTEVDIDKGKETGRTTPGAKHCGDVADGPDPLSPNLGDARIVVNRTSQVRFQDIGPDLRAADAGAGRP